MKHKYPRFLSVLCALMIVTSASWAERVSQEDAALVAGNFMSAGDTTSQGAQAPGRYRPLRRMALAEDAQYYVYANANGEGWVMVAANDVATPIIAYSETGTFDAENQPLNLKSWLGGYNKQIKYAEDNGLEATEATKAEWKALRRGVRKAKASVVVSPLIKTGWDQDSPYWNLCPSKNGNRCYTGCVATAMAQVMNYHQWPKKGTGSSSVTFNGQTYSADFANTTYDWDNMKNTYTSSTSAQKTAVATLMYHCGVGAGMSYGTDGSGAYTINWNDESEVCAQNALWKYFGYKKSELKGYYRDGYSGYYSSWTEANWIKMLKDELDAGRPIMYAGGDAQGESGHSFVCDGYDSDSKFHFNWGWSNSCDGYYSVNSLVPAEAGSGGGNGDYSYQQDVIIGIVPDKKDLPKYNVTWSVKGETTKVEFTEGDALTLPSNPADCSGTNGKKFVGWTANSSVSGSAPTDLFTTAGSKTVTGNITYYAVFATASGSGAASKSYSFNITASDFNTTSYAANNNEKTTTATASDASTIDVKWTSYQVMKNSTNLQFQKNAGYIFNSTDLGTIKSVTVTSSAGSFTTYYGTSAQPSSSTTVGGGFFQIKVGGATGTVSNIAVTFEKSAGGGTTTYSAYSLTCDPPCTSTPTMSFANEEVTKTVNDATYTQTVIISGKGAGQTVSYSSSDATIATVNNSGVVTLKGKVGQTVITASVDANGTYCSNSAEYTLIVTAAPINVTLNYNGTSATLNNQPNPYTLPTSGEYVANMCSGDWTFAGWYGSTYAKNTTAPTYITQMTSTGSAYAVYANTESSGGGSSTESLTFSDSYSSDTEVEATKITIGTHSAVTFTKRTGGTDTKYYASGSAIRWYGGGKCVVESDEGDITEIIFTFGSGDGSNSISSNVGTYNAGIWTGEASSVTFTQGGTSGHRRIAGITVKIGGGSSTTYYATSPDCATPCSITPSMSFTDGTVNKTTSDDSYTQTVTISNQGSGQTVIYSSSDETVGTVDNSGVVTLKGKVGSTTITASVEADGDHCANSASYTLNVTAAPIDVTLYYNGTSASLTGQTNPYTLPTGAPYNTAMCSGDWTFDGWYGSAYTKSTDKPTYITQLTATGSAYAVYKTTETSGSGSSTKSYTFNITTDDFNSTSYAANNNEKTSTATASDASTVDVKWTSSNVMLSGGVIQWKKNAGYIYNSTNLGTIKSVTITSTDGTFTTYYGDEEQPSSSTTVGGGYFKINIGDATGKTSNIAVTFEKTVSGGSSSSTTYYATSPDCVTPCSITPSMSFTDGTVNKTTSDASYTQAVTITDKGSGQTVAYSSSDESVATVDNSGVVTLKGKVGSTTITASVEADGDHCANSASYTINVTAAPINVTLYYNGTSSSLTNQDNPYTLPTGAPYNTAMCSGDWTFDGWYGSAYTKSTDKPTYITELTTTGSAYAVYTTTETSGSGGAGGAVTITTSTTDIPTSYGSSNTFTEYTLEGYKFKIQQMYLNSDKLQWRAAGNNNGTGTMYNNEAFPGNIASIVLTYNSSDGSKNFTIKVGSSANPTDGTSITPTVNNLVYTFDCSSANADYFVLTNGSNAGYLDQIVINYAGGGSSTTFYATSPDCATECMNKVTLEKGTPEHGSFSLDKADGEYNNCSVGGLVVTVSGINPADGYQFKEITQEGINSDVTIDQNAKTVTYAKDVSGSSTINVVFEELPTYTISFYDGTTKLKEQSVLSGQAATPPSDPAGCEGYAFVGWWTETLASTNTTTHAPWVTDFTANDHQNYYAVFAHMDGGSGAAGSYTLQSGNESSSFTIVTGITGSFAKADGTNAPAWYTDAVRAYAGNTLTITSTTGNLTSVEFTFASGDGSNTISASTGTYSNGTWTGDAASVTFTVNGSSGNRRFQTITVGSGTTYYTTTSDCCPNKPTLEFDAPTMTKFDGDEPFTNHLTVTGNDLNVALKFSSSLPAKASVDPSTGQVTILDAMSNTPVTITATLNATKVGDNCQAKATASYTLNIYNKVTWLVNGAEYTSGDPTTQVTEGGTLSAYPTDPDGATVCGGKTFVGWTTAEYEESDTKPATLYKSLAAMSSVHLTESTTYYAVFAESGGESEDEYIKGTKADLAAGQTVLIVHHSSSNALSTTVSGTGYAGVNMTISDGKITTTNSAILWTVEVGDNGGYKFKIGTNYINAAPDENNKHYLWFDEYTDEWMLSGSGPYILASSEDSGYQMEYYNSIFTTYTGTSGTAYEMDFYVPAVGYTAYSTYCGPNIKAQEVERLTSTNGQTVTSQAIAVKGSSLDGSTLSATITGAGAAQFSCVMEATAIVAGAITTTYTISYKPTVYDAIHEAALTFSDGTTSSEPITLRGRSLPEQFAIVAYDGANYYVLDGTMSGEAATVKPLPVTVSDGAVTMCPSRAVYSMTELATPDQNVYLVSNGKRLYGGGSGTGLNMKSLTSTSGTNWLLSTADFSTYHITNATNTDRGVMYSNSSKFFGHYKVSNYGTSGYYGNLLLLPIEAVCTCLDAPQPSVIARSTTATITWGDVTGATRYEVTCSGGSVSVSGTTATITGLTTNTNYTYTLKAVASGTDCSQVYNGGFRTTVCDDVPQDIKVTPNVTSAIVRWTADAEKATVRVYSDAECTSEVASLTNMVSGNEITGLTENQNYYLKVFAGPDQTCASAAVAFNTISTAVEIVEWMTDGVKIILTGDELTATVLVEDKQENKGSTTTNYADSIFISKYFEADSENKLVALYNGTKDTFNLSNYCLKRSQRGSNPNELVMELGSYGRVKPGYIVPNEEIILIRYAQLADKSAEECASEQEGYENWYVFTNSSSEGNFLNFSGPMSIGLYSKTAHKIIDIVGATTNADGTGTLCQIDASNNQSCSAATKSFNDGAGFYTLEGDNYQTEEVETNYGLSTNRCLLIRKNTVKSGLNAVANNVHSSWLACSTEMAEAFTTLSSEWAGFQIGEGSSGGETHSKTCIGMGNVGGFDYQGYYAQFDSVAFVENLINNKNPDGTITIPVAGLDTMSCSMMRIKVYEGGVEKATTEKRVPIMIHSGEIKTTNELFTKHEAAACAECDVVVFSGATLQKGEEASGRNAIHDLTLYPGSTLDLPSGKGDYSVNSIIYRVDGDNVPTTKLEGNLLTESQKLVVTRRITNDRYYFLSMPYDCDLADITLSNGIPAVNGVDYRLLEYDAEARAEEGSRSGVPGHWKLATGTMKAGQGYAIAVSSTKPKEIVFPMTIPSKNLTNEERTKVTNTVDINEYVGAARNTNHNWNLIAHPYITKFEVTGGAENVEAYWESPSRENTDWVDDWKTWDDPTQPTDSTHTQNPDSTGTQTDYIDRGTLNDGCIWVLYNDGTMELSGSGQVGAFSTTDDVPWKAHREKITSVKVIGEIPLINCYAFAQCTNLTNVTISAPVSQINAQAFAACNQLTTIRIESSLSSPITADGEVFDGVDPSKITLMVPQSLLTAYKNTTPWKNMTVKAISGSTTGNAPRRVDHPDGWTESLGGIYVTRPTVTDGKITYEQLWINAVEDIPPFTAMFIQGDGRGEMTFNMYPASPAPKRSARASRYETKDHTIFVGVSLHSTNGMSDLTSLRLRPDFGEHYKFGQDLLKFTVFNTSRPQLYIKTPDDQLAFRAISDSLAEHTWIPVGVYCRDAGTYTFSLYDKYVLDEIEAVYLHDNVTGVTTNLLYGNYTIETTKQLYTNTRFTLNVILRRKVDVDTPTVIEHTEDPNAPRKFFRDGVMYIMRDGKIYDLTGKPAELDKLMLNR